MGLLDDIKQAGTQNRVRCTVGLILPKLEAKDRADLEKALGDLNILATVISKVLTQRGHRVGPEAVRRHRRRLCGCHVG